METRQLRFFCTLAEQLHFTRSAVLLNVSQSSLSQQIKQLEDELGAQLVERTSRTVRLTEAGQLFYSRASRILEQLEQATREALMVGQGDAGSLTIGVVSTAVCSHLPELLRVFRRVSPHLDVDIREMEPGEQLEALRKEVIDIGLLFLRVQDPALDSTVVARERLILALPTGHPAAAQEEIALSALAAETFLIPRQQTIPGYYELILETLAEGGVRAPQLQPTRLLTTAVFLVAGQLGVALVPESFRTQLRIRGCIYRDIAGPYVYADLIGLWRRRDMTPPLRRFVQQLRHHRVKTTQVREP